MKAMILTLAILAPAASMADLNKNDECKVVAQEVAQGVANSYKQFKGQAGKILDLNLSSATEVRLYDFTIEGAGCIDSYKLELSNDSASKCSINSLVTTQICG